MTLVSVFCIHIRLTLEADYTEFGSSSFILGKICMSIAEYKLLTLFFSHQDQLDRIALGRAVWG